MSDIAIGDEVRVPARRGHISRLKRSGTVVAISADKIKVEIQYGRCRGYWYGRVHEVDRFEKA